MTSEGGTQISAPCHVAGLRYAVPGQIRGCIFFPWGFLPFLVNV